MECLADVYLESGPLHGYCWAYQLADGLFTDLNVENGLEIQYALPNTSFNDHARIGCNLNQPRAGGLGSEGEFDPTGWNGVCVAGRGWVRIYIELLDSAQWCVEMPEGDCAAWSEFSTECWPGGNGTPYDGRPLTSVTVTVPSDVSGVPVAGSICVSSIALY